MVLPRLEEETEGGVKNPDDAFAIVLNKSLLDYRESTIFCLFISVGSLEFEVVFVCLYKKNQIFVSSEAKRRRRRERESGRSYKLEEIPMLITENNQPDHQVSNFISYSQIWH